jgi:prepilin-type N-terminal cleavage/methylation domain-containing protein
MRQKLRTRKDAGFTIIEVLIVLAIAGLILLIVFLAVPALERGARNTQRKDDSAAVASAIANLLTNNGGVLPTGLGNDANANTMDVCSAGGGAVGGTTACTGGNVQTAKIGFFTQGNIFMGNAAAGGGTSPTIVAAGSEAAGQISTQSIQIYLGEQCNATNTQGGTANTRTAAIFYVVETGTGTGALQCVEQ